MLIRLHDDTAHGNLHEYLLARIEYDNNSVDSFCENPAGTYFTISLHRKWNDGNELQHRPWGNEEELPAPCPDARVAFGYAKRHMEENDDTEYTYLTLCKRYIGSDGYDSMRILPDGTPLDTPYMRDWRENDKYPGELDIPFPLPTPFKRGDIVQNLERDGERKIYVILNVRENTSLDTGGCNSLMDMVADVYYMEGEKLDWDNLNCYDQLMFYHGELKGYDRLLHVVGEYLANDQPDDLPYLFACYRKLLVEGKLAEIDDEGGFQGGLLQDT